MGVATVKRPLLPLALVPVLLKFAEAIVSDRRAAVADRERGHVSATFGCRVRAAGVVRWSEKLQNVGCTA